jgi:hypothetical protein
MTVTTRDFHIGDILSVTTDRLLSPRHVEGVYDILGWMTGALIAQHPSLAAVTVPEGLHDRATVDAFLATLYAEHGETLPVAPLAAEDHTSMDPLAELRMMRPDLPIIVVEP